jgi:heme-binding NEAT domain protein
VYATAHFRSRDCRRTHYDGIDFVDIDAGFEVAPGDANDMSVANDYFWGSAYLVFSDGAATCNATGSERGMS